MIDINIIAVIFAVASVVLLYLYVTYKPPACPAQEECPGCPACPACPDAECPVQPPCPSFMGFELKGDYQEILELINYIKELNKEIQDGVCGHITPGTLDGVLANMRQIQAERDADPSTSKVTCSVEVGWAQQALIARLNDTNFSTSTKGKITIALVNLLSHIPDAFCDASTGQIDLVKYESVFRNVYKAFCGREL